MTLEPKGLGAFIKESTELEGINGSGRGKKEMGRWIWSYAYMKFLSNKKEEMQVRKILEFKVMKCFIWYTIAEQ